MTDCFPCRWCHYNPYRARLWCYRHDRDVLQLCDDYEREAGADG